MNDSDTQASFFELLRTQGPAQPIDESLPEQIEDDKEDENQEVATPCSISSEEVQGCLPPEAKRPLIALLRHGVLMADNKRLLFEILCRHHAAIQAHLADMNLRMLLDEKAGLAILLQADTDDDEDDESTSLITRRTLTLYDTLLLLVLRKHYQERETAGEQRVIIDSGHIQTALGPFLPLTNSSRSDKRQLNGALNNLKDRRILAAVRGEEDRYEITPVIRYLVNAEYLEQMLIEYTDLAARTGIDLDESSND